MIQTLPIQVGRFSLANPLVLSPMCGITDLPTRLLARRHGAALCFTQMVSAEGYLRKSNRTEDLLATSNEDVRLGVQIFGGHPEILARAAREICDNHNVTWIDLNMGCPVRKVACREAGSGLLKDLSLVRRIFETMRAALPNENFTVKIRAGWDDKSLVIEDLALLVDDCGVDGITLHPRTRVQGYSGTADWTRIARLRECVKRTPVFGSGDLFTPANITAMMKQTGANGAFVARGSIGNPWIFSRTLAVLEGREDPGLPSARELFDTIADHLSATAAFYGEIKGVKIFRAHLAGYIKGLRYATAMRRSIFKLKTQEEMKSALASFLLEDGGPSPWETPGETSAADMPPLQVA